jgi:hypothetical protein
VVIAQVRSFIGRWYSCLIIEVTKGGISSN